MSSAATRKHGLLIFILIVAFAGAGLLYQRWRDAQPAARAAAVPYQSGVALAELAARYGGNQPRLLLVLPDATGDDILRDWLQLQRRALEKKLPSKAQIIGVETIAGGRGRRAGFTTALLDSLVKKHAATSVVVSLAGAPAPDAMAAKGPPLICFAPDGSSVAELMKRGLLAAAVVPRNQRVPIEAAQGAWFDVLYQVVTPDTLSAWQSGTTSR